MRIVALTGLTAVLLASSSWAGEKRVVWFGFEEDGLTGWAQVRDGRTVTDGAEITAFGSGPRNHHATMRFERPQSGMIYRTIPIPPAEGSGDRGFRLELTVQCAGIDHDKMELLVQKQFADERAPEWYERTAGSGYMVKIPGPWMSRRAHVLGTISPEVTGLTVYLKATNTFGTGTVSYDNVALMLVDREIGFESDRLGNVFPGERATMRLVMAGADPISGGQVTLRDEEDRVLQTLAIPSGREWMEIELPTRGYYHLTAEATYRDGTVERRETSAAVVGPLIPDELRMQSRFGFNGCIEELSVMAGARWDRRFLDDARIFPDADIQIPSHPATQPSTGERFTTVPCHNTQPSWIANRGGDPKPHSIYPMTQPAKFADMMRYEKAVLWQKDYEYYEVGNEYNCNWRGTPEELVEHHRQVAEAVRSVSPGAKIIGPSPAIVDIDWLKSLFERGLLDHIDVLGIHTYVKATPPEAEFIEKVRELKSHLASIGKGGLPIFVTEYGWTTPPGDWQRPIDELTRARYVSRSLTLLTAENIDAIMYFLSYWWMEGGVQGYSLMNMDVTPRPGYAAYANATRFLTGTTGPGKVLPVTPTTYMAVFERLGKTVVVAWDTAGESRVFVPQPWTEIRDMTGRPVKHDGPVLPVSPSPIFVELPDRTFYDMASVRSSRVRQSDAVALPWTPSWVPAPLTVDGQTIGIPVDAPTGPYLVLGKTPTGWQTVRIDVEPLLEVLGAELSWPTSQPTPSLRVKVRSGCEAPVTVVVRAEIKGLCELSGAPAQVAPKSTAELSIPLPALQPARRYMGEVLAATEGAEHQARARLGVDLTYVPPVPRGNAIDEGVRALDISSWGPFGGPGNAPKEIAPDDCSATLQLAYDDGGLHARVVVRDNAHMQSQEPKDMWQQDSVQFAFDMDAEKPWVANAGGCNGHFKVFEYGFALTEHGPINWRWISFEEALPAGQVEERLKAGIARTGDLTVYELTFPWATLGLTEAPKPGAVFGFAMVVNDTDPGTDRNGLPFFGGIVEDKDPAKFGTLRFQ